jgi:cell division protein FtsI (penicillin-binding protein 3)
MSAFAPRSGPCSPRHADPRPPRREEIVQLDGAAKKALETGRSRLLIGAVVFGLAFLVIIGRLADVSLLQDVSEPRLADQAPVPPVAERADIIDRNGIVLATSLATFSLFATPSQVQDADEAAKELAGVLPDLSAAELKAKLASDKTFVWLQRNLTPRQQLDVTRLGIPGLYFQAEEKRVYPLGSLVSHVVGFTDLDNKGIAGIEDSFDDVLAGGRHPVQLSLDVRIQQILREELTRGISDFSAIGGAGIVLDARTGEILAMVSLPDFDPNQVGTASPEQRFNRATLGIYEMGSTFKVFNTAMALDSGRIHLTDRFDVHPISIGRYTIHDFEPMNHHAVVQHRRGTHGDGDGYRQPEILPRQGRHAASGECRAAGSRPPAVSRRLETDQHHDDCLRPWHRRQPAACRLRRRRHGEWRDHEARHVD